MNRGTRHLIAISRWLMPLSITLIGFAIFGQRTAQGVLPQHKQQISLLSACVMLWAGAAWWTASNTRRYLRFYERLQQQRLLLPAILMLSALALLDFFTLFLQDLFPVISRHFFLLSNVNVCLLALFTLLLSAHSPGSMLQSVARVLGVFGVLLLLSEMIFRFGIVDYLLPQNSREFMEQIASQWPQPATIAKPADALRILGLGGVFGKRGGDGNYHRVIEADLRRQIPKTEVLNFSKEGFLLAQNAEIFMRFGTQYQPDIVLHSLFVGRDIWSDPSVDVLVYHGMPFEKKRGVISWTPHNFLLRQWMVALFSPTIVNANDANISYELRWKPLERMAICRKDLPQAHPQIWKTAEKLLDQIVRVAKNYNAQYLLVIHPDQFQIESRIIEEIQETKSVKLNDFDLRQPQRLLLEYCRARGIACLDLLPAFEEQGRDGGLYAPDGQQYSETGHQLVAREIERFLAAAHQSDEPEIIAQPTPEILPTSTPTPTSTPLPTPTPAPVFKIQEITITDSTGAPLIAEDDIYTVHAGETLTISVNVENSASQHIIGHWSALNGDIQDTSALTNKYTASKLGVDYVIIAIENATTGDTYEEPINITVR